MRRQPPEARKPRLAIFASFFVLPVLRVPRCTFPSVRESPPAARELPGEDQETIAPRRRCSPHGAGHRSMRGQRLADRGLHARGHDQRSRSRHLAAADDLRANLAELLARLRLDQRRTDERRHPHGRGVAPAVDDVHNAARVDEARGERRRLHVAADEAGANLAIRHELDVANRLEGKGEQSPAHAALLRDREMGVVVAYDVARFDVGDEARHVLVVGEHGPGHGQGRAHRTIHVDEDFRTGSLHPDRDVVVGRGAQGRNRYGREPAEGEPLAHGLRPDRARQA